MSYKLALTVVAACAVLSACAAPPYKNIGQSDPFFGESVKYNAAVQTINPDPVYAEGLAEPGDNGSKGAAAVRRYRTDETLQRHNREARQTSAQSTTSGPR